MMCCLDASVFVKWLVPEEGSEAAESLIRGCLEEGIRLISPPFLWAEVGSVLRRKAHWGQLTDQEAIALFDHFLRLPVEGVTSPDMWRLAWTWAQRSAQPTLYDACYVAVADSAGVNGDEVQFWTADASFLRDLGQYRPEWARALEEWRRWGGVGP
jgi:predicted nucleic acid-binding protein